IRVRRSGSSGGHNGLRDIAGKCGGEEFPRVKLGVGEPQRAQTDMADWVLTPFYGRDFEEFTAECERTAECVECIVKDGMEKAMSRFN
ncbi:MAG: aminoacyl-tRNA hydrolase, partial [Oscillospiraceae bacterium]|nr:aminoacyl-tRNA hydrolase [Oscillospiraceae bacterium]